MHAVATAYSLRNPYMLLRLNYIQKRSLLSLLPESQLPDGWRVQRALKLYRALAEADQNQAVVAERSQEMQ